MFMSTSAHLACSAAPLTEAKQCERKSKQQQSSKMNYFYKLINDMSQPALYSSQYIVTVHPNHND